MANNRANIRQAVVTILSGQTDAGNRVYASRTKPLSQNLLPAILVFAQEETTEPRDLAGQQYRRTLSLNIEVYAEANEGLDDTLDSISADIETAIASNRSLNTTAQGALLTRSEFEIDDQGEKPVGKLTLSYEVKYSG